MHSPLTAGCLFKVDMKIFNGRNKLYLTLQLKIISVTFPHICLLHLLRRQRLLRAAFGSLHGCLVLDTPSKASDHRWAGS